MERLQWFDIWQLRAAAKQNDDHLITGIISGLVKSRQQLYQLAINCLPHHELCSLSLPSCALLDTKASEVYDMLERHEIKAHDSSDESHSVYSCADDNIAVFEHLYTAGFTDLNQCDGDSMALLLDLYHGFDSRNPFNLIRSAEWLVSRGANLYQLSEEGYPSIFSLADAFGDALATLV
ncbi:hypothetical protein BJY04DRAFT_179559 [Aspergillus karnatakaensis]|uniref:uncharacterized protein n=1 Tax=Aspergillus karnatakaensis TaxID=1810916 RepID=UPI003CCD9665